MQDPERSWRSGEQRLWPRASGNPSGDAIAICSALAIKALTGFTQVVRTLAQKRLDPVPALRHH
mgnify:CR=1 FL=1